MYPKRTIPILHSLIAGWSSLVARQAHNPAERDRGFKSHSHPRNQFQTRRNSGGFFRLPGSAIGRAELPLGAWSLHMFQPSLAFVCRKLCRSGARRPSLQNLQNLFSNTIHRLSTIGYWLPRPRRKMSSDRSPRLMTWGEHGAGNLNE